MENPYLAMLWSAFGQALPYLVFLAAFVVALKWLEAKFMPKRRGRKWRGDRRPWRQQGDKVVGFRPKHDALPDQVALYVVSGFRSLQNFEICLEQGLNVFLGVNGAGKTNFIDFLDFLSNLLRVGGSAAVSASGGIARVFSQEALKRKIPRITARVHGIADLRPEQKLQKKSTLQSSMRSCRRDLIPGKLTL